MKRFIFSLTGIFSLLALTMLPISAYAATYWQVSISAPASQRTHSFNVQYSVLSTEADSFTVKLFQTGNPTALATQDTSSDPHAVNGNSGAFNVTVAADGDYSYYIVASRDESADPDQTTPTKNVHVDATAPDAPIYHGKTLSGKTYTLSFTAPSSPDVTHVQIFASTNQTYQASDSTRVGDVSVAPNESKTFTYTAPDAAPRYFALQAFDSAGNGSGTVGDPGTVVNPVRFINQGGAGGGAAGGAGGGAANNAAAGGGGGQVQGVTTENSNGQINAPGKSNNKSNNGKVLGAETSKQSNKKGWLAAGGILILILAAYYWFAHPQKNLFKKKS